MSSSPSPGRPQPPEQPEPPHPQPDNAAAEHAARAFEVPAPLEGARLDKALVALAKVSRSGAKALLAAGVRVNGRRAVKGGVVHEGDLITLDPSAGSDADPRAIPDPSVPLDVRLERDDVLVVHKPAGIATAPLRPGELGTLTNALVARYPDVSAVGSDPREPGLLHRLDNDTSGLLLVARTAAAWDELKDAFRRGAVEKRYLCVVALGGGSSRAASVPASGELADRGTIEFPLAPHPKDVRRVFACVHARDVQRLAPRDAATRYVVQRRWTSERGDRALVEATTARALRHQIRVHFAAVGAPLVGDGLYGGPAAPDLGRHALHASRISYGGGARVKAFVVDAPLPDDLAALCESP